MLVSCDVAQREFILWLNEREKFVVREVDETHLLIKAEAVEGVKRAISENFEKNVFAIEK